MILSWGDYDHQPNSVWFPQMDQWEVYSPIGRRMVLFTRLVIRGTIKADTVADLTTALTTLESKYKDGGNKDLIFWADDAKTTQTIHSITNSSTIGGTKVKSFRYLNGNPRIWGSGTEYVNIRTFEVVIEAEVLRTDSNVIRLHESVTVVGNGGQKFIMMGALTGSVQAQIVQQATPYLVIQQGYAVGRVAYPSFPDPISTGALHNEAVVQTKETPKFDRVTNTMYPIKWKYVMESATSLSGSPVVSP